ncbi:MAG: hypothetical protein A2033_10320 [Bacteroidetes bacterium GWA2_31_9]|nr:MAG: hypothetical protein A2033_10320 [Bacteroidetes bacterium GWA2_31_9]
MKVGTDGVLLGAWANVENASTILDIGTGSGLIALMVAQRSDAEIYAIDIDKNAFLQASENVINSKWNERINVEQVDFYDFAKNSKLKFDSIISNPPFFKNSLKNPALSKSIARHDVALNYEQLISESVRILTKNGNLSIIIPANEFENIEKLAFQNNLKISRKTFVKPAPAKNPIRVLLELIHSKNSCNIAENEIVIEDGNRHCYTAEYISLTKDFYLNF